MFPNPYQPPLTVPEPPVPARLVLAPNVASRTRRIAAAIVDWVLFGIVICSGSVIVDILQPWWGPPSHSGPSAFLVAIGSLPVVWFVIEQWRSTAATGQTFGKKALRIRLANLEDDLVPSFGRSVVLRCWVNGLTSFIPIIGQLYVLIDVMSLFETDRRCLHDGLAGTRVIRITAT